MNRPPLATEKTRATFDIADQYLGVEILVIKVNQMARGFVVAQKRDTNRNAMKRAHANPVLDTRVYQGTMLQI